MVVGHGIDVSVPVVFPAASAPVALAAIVTITLLVIRPSLRRATKIQPGLALRSL